MKQTLESIIIEYSLGENYFFNTDNESFPEEYRDSIISPIKLHLRILQSKNKQDMELLNRICTISVDKNCDLFLDTVLKIELKEDIEYDA